METKQQVTPEQEARIESLLARYRELNPLENRMDSAALNERSVIIVKIAEILGIPQGKSCTQHNKVIDWLDKWNPEWRGFPVAYKVLTPTMLEKGRIKELKNPAARVYFDEDKNLCTLDPNIWKSIGDAYELIGFDSISDLVAAVQGNCFDWKTEVVILPYGPKGKERTYLNVPAILGRLERKAG